MEEEGMGRRSWRRGRRRRWGRRRMRGRWSRRRVSQFEVFFCSSQVLPFPARQYISGGCANMLMRKPHA